MHIHEENVGRSIKCASGEIREIESMLLGIRGKTILVLEQQRTWQNCGLVFCENKDQSVSLLANVSVLECVL